MPVNKARKDLNRVYGTTGTQDVDTETQDRQLIVDDDGRLVTKQADASGTVINPRKEDGHGSAAGTPTHVNKAQSGGAALPAAAAAADAESNATLIERMAARLFAYDPATGWFRIRGTVAGGLDTNVTDRDARLLGRTKLLNVAGAVINPATEDTLAAFKVENDANMDSVIAALVAANASLDAIEAAVQSIAAEDFATETTLAGLRSDLATALAAVNASLDFIEADADAIRIAVEALALEDFATETTLAAFKAETDANLDLVNAELDAITASLGTDGAAPPAIAGTGVRGWLRAIYDKLVAGLGVTGPITATEYRVQPAAGATTSPVAGAAASTALASSASRVSALVQNLGLGTARIAVGGTTPTATLGHQLLPGDAIVVPGGAEIKCIREGAVDAQLQVSAVTY